VTAQESLANPTLTARKGRIAVEQNFVALIASGGGTPRGRAGLQLTGGGFQPVQSAHPNKPRNWKLGSVLTIDSRLLNYRDNPGVESQI